MTWIGYNSKKWGHPSYHLILCQNDSIQSINSIIKDFWHRGLRLGDTHTETGPIELIRASFAKLPLSVKKVTIRANKCFKNHEIIKSMESKRNFFIIVVKLTTPIKRELSSLSCSVHSLGLGKIPTKQFAAYETYFHILLFSYNLIDRFKKLCLSKEFQNMDLNTFGTEFYSSLVNW